MSDSEDLPAVFFATASDNEPVRIWLKALPKAARKQIGEHIRVVQKGWPIGMPVCRPLGKGIYEVRTSLPDHWARVFFCVKDGEMILLHAIMKKSNKIPPSDLKLAEKRKKQWEKKS